jgi:putative transposase
MRPPSPVTATATGRVHCWAASGRWRSICPGPVSTRPMARPPNGRAARCGPTSARTLAADALIAGCYLAGTNTRRVRRALGALFASGVGKDTVSRVWRKVKSDWDARNARPLAEEPIVRLILDGTVVRVRLDRRAIAISLLVVIGVRADGQKVLLAVKAMGSESSEAWRAVLDDLVRRGLRRPEFLIVDGAPGLENAIAAVWNGVPVQRCTVHKHRNLLAHAPERLHQEITADYNDMIYRGEIERRHKAFIRKWRLKHRAVADSLEEAGDRLFTFTRLPPSQWKSGKRDGYPTFRWGFGDGVMPPDERSF